MFDRLREFAENRLLDPPWREVRALGHLPILGISLTTVLTVPIVARIIFNTRELLHSLGRALENDSLSIWVQSIADSLQLPMVIKLLVWSAMFAVIGKAIYNLACPSYYRIGETFEEFRRKYSYAAHTIQNDFMELYNESEEAVRGQILADLVHNYGTSITFYHDNNFVNQIPQLKPDSILHIDAPNRVSGRPPDVKYSDAIKRPEFGRIVWEVLLFYRDHYRRFWRVTCAWAFYLAVSLGLAAFLLQVRWVLLAMV